MTIERLFYLDPFYWGCEKDYGKHVLGRNDFDQLAAQPGGIKDKFLMAINDTPGVRPTFAKLQMTEVDTTYTVGAGSAVEAAVLILLNFELI